MQFRSAVKSPLIAGFTLIEMSIVLVIIGLIIGGVLVGRDLISAAAARAQISQIEKYNTAVNTFQGKYGYLPGDIPDPTATQYGFIPRGTSWAGPIPGQGDGDGIITGITTSDCYSCNRGGEEAAGESPMFWVDLSTAQLIDGGFTAAGANGMNYAPSAPYITLTSSPNIAQYFPAAKLGGSNYVYVYSGNPMNINANYYGISVVTLAQPGRYVTSTPGMSVSQAYNIDTKIDDGLPQSGKVAAQYVNTQLGRYVGVWAAGGGSQGANCGFGCATPPWNSYGYGPTTAATAGSSTTCYDNGNVAGTQNYSMEQNGGANINCALSFQFQ